MADSENSDVASLIRDLRARKGASLRSAARELGINASHLARVESGEKTPSEELGRRMSDYYDVDSDEVYLAAGRLPPDIVEILIHNPKEIELLRRRYSSP